MEYTFADPITDDFRLASLLIALIIHMVTGSSWRANFIPLIYLGVALSVETVGAWAVAHVFVFVGMVINGLSAASP